MFKKFLLVFSFCLFVFNFSCKNPQVPEKNEFSSIDISSSVSNIADLGPDFQVEDNVYISLNEKFDKIYVLNDYLIESRIKSGEENFEIRDNGYKPSDISYLVMTLNYKGLSDFADKIPLSDQVSFAAYDKEGNYISLLVTNVNDINMIQTGEDASYNYYQIEISDMYSIPYQPTSDYSSNIRYSGPIPSGENAVVRISKVAYDLFSDYIISRLKTISPDYYVVKHSEHYKRHYATSSIPQDLYLNFISIRV